MRKHDEIPNNWWTAGCLGLATFVSTVGVGGVLGGFWGAVVGAGFGCLTFLGAAEASYWVLQKLNK
ncbi:MAG: hypothetical protein ACXABY_17880 [Candidatus Thorarchaeota archaeon]|jgi:hypothetical protein